ncbi:MAG: outer membrane beta-barrel protein [Burkholderiales bacterium]|nr:outer membrane beta-barrel protein [Burkholderiales bacterium]
MKYKKIIIAVYLAVIWISSSAEIESSAYINIIVGYGFVSNGTNTSPTNNTSIAGSVFSGYAFNQYFALDGGITVMPNTYQNQNSMYLIPDIAARGSIPLSNFVSAYIHVGPAMLFNLQNETNNDQLGVFVGLGALFQLSYHFGINIEDYGVYIPGNTNSNINVIGLGMMYAF